MRKFWLGLLIVLAPLARADEAALQKLSAQLDPLKSMRAQFVQTVADEHGKILQTSQGTLVVKRTNQLRWETTAPFAYLIVTDGSVLWRYDRDLEQATKQPFKGELADTPALIFSGDSARIRANYTVSWQRGTTGDQFTLVPKQSNALFHSLSLQFTGRVVQQLVLLDNLDQRTEIRFSGVVPNPAIDAAEFRFNPPAGVDVIVDES